MSNAILTRPWNPRAERSDLSNTTALPPRLQTVLFTPRRAAPLYKLAMIILAVGGSACAIAMPENPCQEDAAGVESDATSCALQAETVGGQATDSIENKILALVNGERRGAGVRPLCFSRELASVAGQHNSRMASEGFFEHRGEGEQCLLDRVTFAGIDAESVGENIFKASQPGSDGIAQQCVAMWMQSDGHRRNMLSSDFDKTGISVSYSSQGECYVTQDFAHLTPIFRQLARRTTARYELASSRSRRGRRSSYGRPPLSNAGNRYSTRAVLGSPQVRRLPSRKSESSFGRSGRVVSTTERNRQVSREKRDRRRS